MIDDIGPEGMRERVEERLGRTLADFALPAPDARAARPPRRARAEAAGPQLHRRAGAPRADLGRPDDRRRRPRRARRRRRAHHPPAELHRRQRAGRAGRRASSPSSRRIGFSLDVNHVRGRSIGCTGEPHCNFSVTETKQRLGRLIEHLEARFGDAISSLGLQLDGCPHACAQHWIADLGFQGTTARDADGKRVQAYDIFVRGGLGAGCADRQGAVPARPERGARRGGRRTHPGLARRPRQRGRDVPRLRAPPERRGARRRRRARARQGTRTRGGGMSTELFDELEAGELSVEFEGEEPETVLEWALERFATASRSRPRSRSTVCVLIDMAARIRPDVRVFSVDTGRLPQETHDLADAIRDALSGAAAGAARARRRAAAAPRRARRARTASGSSVEQRLICCNVRKVQPLTKHLQALDAWISGLRRDQWATRTNIRKVEIDHDHDAIVKLNPLAEWSEDEVWDYVRENDVPDARALRARLHLDRLRAVHARDRARRAGARRAAGGGRAARPRSAASTARSRPAASSTSCTRSWAATAMSEARRRAPGRGRRGRAGRGHGGARDGAGRGPPRRASPT